MAGPWRCYASDHGDCAGGASKEHYISSSVLRLLDKSTTFEGMPGIPEDKPIGIRSLATKILCRHHNETLANLDATAGSFFESVFRFDGALGPACEHIDPETVTVNGELLERWLLKVAFGLAAANERLGRTSGIRDRDALLPVLFGRRSLPKHWGMYFVGTVGMQLLAPANVAVRTLVDPRDGAQTVWSVTVWSRFLPLNLALGRPDSPDVNYRPSAFQLGREGLPGRKTIHLKWYDGAVHRPVDLVRTGETTEWATI